MRVHWTDTALRHRDAICRYIIIYFMQARGRRGQVFAFSFVPHHY